MNKKLIWLVLCLTLALPLAAFAQDAKEAKEPVTSEAPGWTNDDPPVWMAYRSQPPLQFQNETPEERMKRNGITEDPGTDPDTTRIWERSGARYQITRFPRETAVYYRQKKGWVRPMMNINSAAEIYQENAEFVWVWLDIPDEASAAVLSPALRKTFGYEVDDSPEAAPDAAADPKIPEGAFARDVNYVTITDEVREYLTELKKEFALVTPAESGITVAFEEASTGLPTQGSWRNGLDVADMNADGRLDIIVPPPRGGNSFPSIYLGTADGTWRAWQDARWPAGYNYGSVAAGDLNGDGHMDLALGAHLMRPVALLGDGKGTFVEATEGLPERFATRRVALADADKDGDLDMFVLSEAATVGNAIERSSRLRLFLNDGSARWQQVQVAESGRQVGGDWMTVSDFNGDGRLDVAGASVFFSGPDLVYVQTQNGGWAPWGRGSLPFRSFYSALTAGDFTKAKGNDLMLSYRRVWPRDQLRPGDFEPPAATSVVGIERVTWDRRGRPERSTVVSWDRTKPVWGLASGDFDGDGNHDLVYTLSGPRRLEFLLGDGKGGFRSATVSGVELPDLTAYDLKVADVNGDGRDDVLIMFEKSDRASDGSVRVFLGRGRASK